MISLLKKTIIKWAIAALVLILLAGCTSLNNAIPGGGQGNTSTSHVEGSPTDSQQNTDTNNATPTLTPPSSPTESNSIVYNNTKYGFSFTLPDGWKGYSIVSGKWEGLAVKGEKVIETGPIISIRNPRWSSKNPMQDIPIMVFTTGQWDSLQKDVFHIGAASIGPSELGRNNSYVFALPARYNFAFLTGYEEVEKILEGKPLKTTQVSPSRGSVESLLTDMVELAKQGKVINSDFSAKTNTIKDVEKVLGKADKTEWVDAAKGSYSTYIKHHVVFGINKGEQIFEVRSSDSRLNKVSIAQVKNVLGNPVYDAKANNQEIIGYTTGSEFKIEMVFQKPTKEKPNPLMDHYNVFYPKGTVNNMADDPGRQW